MKTKGVRTLKNGATAGYVKQKDGSWKWRFITGPKKLKQKGGWGFVSLNSLSENKNKKQTGGWGMIPLNSLSVNKNKKQKGGWGGVPQFLGMD